MDKKSLKNVNKYLPSLLTVNREGKATCTTKSSREKQCRAVNNIQYNV